MQIDRTRDASMIRQLGSARQAKVPGLTVRAGPCLRVVRETEHRSLFQRKHPNLGQGGERDAARSRPTSDTLL